MASRVLSQNEGHLRVGGKGVGLGRPGFPASNPFRPMGGCLFTEKISEKLPSNQMGAHGVGLEGEIHDSPVHKSPVGPCGVGLEGEIFDTSEHRSPVGPCGVGLGGEEFDTPVPLDVDVLETELALSVAREGDLERKIASLEGEIGQLHQELDVLKQSTRNQQEEQGLGHTPRDGRSHAQTDLHQPRSSTGVCQRGTNGILQRIASDMHTAKNSGNSTVEREAAAEEGEGEVCALRQAVQRLQDENRKLECQVHREAVKGAVQVMDLEAQNRLLQEMLDRVLNNTKEKTTPEWIQHLATSVC